MRLGFAALQPGTRYALVHTDARTELAVIDADSDGRGVVDLRVNATLRLRLAPQDTRQETPQEALS